MRKSLRQYVITFLAMIIFPYIMTVCINGTSTAALDELSAISTGRDVIMYSDDRNYLIDVEEYIAGVLPSIVDPGSDAWVLRAQAVAVRTEIYYAMGDNTVIDSRSLSYTYYTREEYISMMGLTDYRKYIERCNVAVLETVGEVIN